MYAMSPRRMLQLLAALPAVHAQRGTASAVWRSWPSSPPSAAQSVCVPTAPMSVDTTPKCRSRTGANDAVASCASTAGQDIEQAQLARSGFETMRDAQNPRRSLSGTSGRPRARRSVA
jgi:hypothetical protein